MNSSKDQIYTFTIVEADTMKNNIKLILLLSPFFVSSTLYSRNFQSPALYKRIDSLVFNLHSITAMQVIDSTLYNFRNAKIDIVYLLYRKSQTFNFQKQHSNTIKCLNIAYELTRTQSNYKYQNLILIDLAKTYNRIGLKEKANNYLQFIAKNCILHHDSFALNVLKLTHIQQGDIAYYSKPISDSMLLKLKLKTIDSLYDFFIQDSSNFQSITLAMRCAFTKVYILQEVNKTQYLIALNKLYSLSLRYNQLHIRCNVLFDIAKYHYFDNNYQLALDYFKLTYQNCLLNSDHEVLSRTCYYLSLLHTYYKNYSKSKFFIEASDLHANIIDERKLYELQNVHLIINDFNTSTLTIQKKYYEQKFKNLNITNKIRILILSVGLLLILFISIWFYSNAKIQKAKLNIEILKNDHFLLEKNQTELILKNEKIEIEAELKGYQNATEYISKELHDQVANSLASVKMIIGFLLLKFPDQKELKKIKNIIQQIHYKIRNLSHSLHTPDIQELTLSELISLYVEDFNNKGSTEFVHLNLHIPSAKQISITCKTDIYLIIQELLINIHRHAKSNTIYLIVTATQTDLTIQIKDDGIGFEYNLVSNKGIGLRNIKYRINKYKGQMQIKPNFPKGTIVEIVIQLS